MAEGLLTTVEAAARLGIARRTLEDWRVRGGGPPFAKLGSRVLYDPAELAAFVQARTRTNTAGGLP